MFASVTGLGECARCPTGQYQSSTNATACIDCDPGGYCGEGSPSVALCPAGTLSASPRAANESTCTPCPPGRWCPPGATEGAECAVGTVSNASGAKTCVPCPAGRFQSNTGETSCHECEVGGYCGMGAVTTTLCPAGTSSSKPGQRDNSTCELVLSGWSATIGSTVASICAAGTFTSAPGQARCEPCSAGSFQDLPGQTACKMCSVGFICVQGSVVELPATCEKGFFANGTIETAANCTRCPAGSYCTGANAPAVECSPGSYADSTGQTACDRCAAGRFQPGAGSAGCIDCTQGGYCGVGSAIPTLCTAGSYGNASGLASQANCTACPPGHSCSLGATEPAPCVAGTAAPNASSAKCTRCEAGSYQGGEGATSCWVCNLGGHCEEGSVAPKPCESGSFGNTTALASQDGCHACPMGSSCTLGANDPTRCAAGTFSDALGVSSCGQCSAGTYQGDEGSTVCATCTQGGYCPVGATAPTLCEAGSYGNASGLMSQANCTVCPRGHACSIGATSPDACLPGTFAANLSSSRCERCPFGSYQRAAGTSSCSDCGPGLFCPPGSSIPMRAACTPGTFSNATELASLDDCGACPIGSSCGGGSSPPKLCMAGRFANESGLVDCSACSPGKYQPEEGASNCTTCPEGHACAEGAKSPIECPAGSAASFAGSAVCQRCLVGSYQGSGRATTCNTCEVGGYCEEGSVAPTPCAEGSFGNTTALTSQEGCHTCPAGSSCTLGATEPRPCLAGTIADQDGLDECTACRAGKFQGSTGQSACSICLPGSYCPTGAVAPVMCAAGSYSGATGNAAPIDCTSCPSGAFCSIGATEPTPCNPGSFASRNASGLCSQCDAGTFQPALGGTACKTCTKGSFCLVGAAAALPCPGGTYSNATGLSTDLLCRPVQPGYWAPTGSALPEPCPVSGFFCPGQAADDVNQVPGSKPILVSVGAMSTSVEEVILETRVTGNLTLEQSLDDLDPEYQNLLIPSLRLGLSGLYGVPVEAVEVSLAAGSIVVSFNIVSKATNLTARANAVSSLALSSALGMNATLLGNVNMAVFNVTVTKAEESDCPPGFWCSAGKAIPCVRNTFNELRNADDQSYCLPCPENSITLEEGSTSFSDCVCARGFFGDTRLLPILHELRAMNQSRSDEFRLNASRFCLHCVSGTACIGSDENTGAGVTLETLPLLPGYWRNSPASLDIRSCGDNLAGVTPGCRGGAGEPCKDWLTGPRCTLCNETAGRYYSQDAFECNECSAGTIVVPMILLASMLAALLLGPATCVGLKLPKRLGLEFQWKTLKPRLNEIGVTAKFKLLASFYQICTKIPVIYQVQLPERVAEILEKMSDLLTLNFDELWKPLQCLQVRGFYDQLLVLVVAPVSIVLLTPLAAAVHIHCKPQHQRSQNSTLPREALLEALPMALVLLFLAYPTVSSFAFLAFNCEEFDGEPDGPWYEREVESISYYYMKADFSVQCYVEVDGELLYSTEYDRIRRLAYVAILLYPLGVPAFFAILLFSCHNQLRDGRALSTLARALRFLYKEYDSRFYYWELMVMAQKLVLVGILSQVQQGSLTQAVGGVAASFGFIVLHMNAQPFHNIVDDYLGTATNFSLAIIMFVVVILKVGILRQELHDYLTSELLERFDFDEVTVTAALLVALFFSLALALLFVLLRLADAGTVRVLRLGSGTPIRTGLVYGKKWNLFLSHAWASAQDQAATIKRQLQLLVPDASIFLDVDDLEDTGALEEEIAATQTVLIILSTGYFSSRNCLRELMACVGNAKPLVLVHEEDESKGGAPLEKLKSECPTGKVVRFVFWPEDRPRHVIAWQRVTAFQLVSLKLIVKGMLASCPEYINKQHVPYIYMPNELPRLRLCFRSRVKLYASEYSHGAIGMARVLQTGLKGRIDVVTGALKLRANSRRTKILSRASLGESSTKDGVTHFLLYLTSRVFAGDEGNLLAAQVRDARSVGMPIVLVHENDPASLGCPFSHFFSVTPQDLVSSGLYRDVAIASFPGPYRPTSLAIAAMKLGAVKSWGFRRHVFSTEATAEAAEKVALEAAEEAAAQAWQAAATEVDVTAERESAAQTGGAAPEMEPLPVTAALQSAQQAAALLTARRADTEAPPKTAVVKKHGKPGLQQKKARGRLLSHLRNKPAAKVRTEQDVQPNEAADNSFGWVLSLGNEPASQSAVAPAIMRVALARVHSSITPHLHKFDGLSWDDDVMPALERAPSLAELEQAMHMPHAFLQKLQLARSVAAAAAIVDAAMDADEGSIRASVGSCFRGESVPSKSEVPDLMPRSQSSEEKIRTSSFGEEEAGCNEASIRSQSQGTTCSYAVGARVVHNLHGAGTVVELMGDERTRVRFDTGEEHRYNHSSLHRLVPEETLDDKSLLIAQQHAKRTQRRKLSLIEGFAAGMEGESMCSKDRPTRETSQSIRRRPQMIAAASASSDALDQTRESTLREGAAWKHARLKLGAARGVGGPLVAPMQLPNPGTSAPSEGVERVLSSEDVTVVQQSNHAATASEKAKHDRARRRKSIQAWERELKQQPGYCDSGREKHVSRPGRLPRRAGCSGVDSGAGSGGAPALAVLRDAKARKYSATATVAQV